MKKTISYFCLLLAVFIVISGCKKKDNDSDNTTTTGNLQVQFSWYSGKDGSKADTNLCEITDIKGTLLSIAVSTQDIVPGKADDLTWTTIYTASTPLYFTERTAPVVNLPAGLYKSIRIIQKNTIIWECTYNSTTYEFEDFNNSSLGPDDIVPTNYFYNGGLYYLDSLGQFQYANAESVGSFQIESNKTTSLNWRMNLTHLNWIDVDTNGVWNTGIDKLDNWQTPPGITTMFDFIVTY
jgi:hypothetical protein